MIRIRHFEQGMLPEKAIAIYEWLLNNFDFERGYITVNQDEDVRYDRSRIAQHLIAARRVNKPMNMLRTYYFHEDQAEQAIFYRMKFA